MSASAVWGPAPLGLDLTDNQNAKIIASVVVVMTLGLSAVALRFIARLSRTGPGIGLDDYFILVAALLGIGTAICCLISIQWGGGKHLWVVSADEFTKLYQTTYAFVIVYINGNTFTKTSILLFYRRIFGANIAWHIVFGFAVAHGAEVTITWLAGCRPVSYYWQQYTDPTAVGSCIDASLFYFINGIIGVVIDFLILLVPLPTIYNLQMRKSQKFFVFAILLLGSFVCIASIVRVVFMDKLVKTTDFTWAMCQVFIWSCVEPFIGIVCACLPTYAPLVRHWYTTSKSHASGSKPKHYVSDKSDKSRKREWSRIHETPRVESQGDDEIELTNIADPEVATGGNAYSYHVRTGREEYRTSNEIRVTKETMWHSTG